MSVLSTPSPLPSSARVLIIGGGVVGCSVAYHLGLLGWGASTLLVESGQLGCGTTWHAAGLVGQLRATAVETRLSGVYGCELYARLEQETGVATGFRQTGSLTIARTADRLALLKRQASRAAAFGIRAELISPQEAGQRWPLMRTDDLVGALWLPGDGSITSTDLTASLAAGARQRGVTIRERTRVTSTTVEGGRVTRVHTDRGSIDVEAVVNCAGQWAREVGLLSGVTVPLHSAEHFYVVTDPLTPPVPTSLPVLRDPDSFTYYREWSGGLCMGGFEPSCKPAFAEGVPANFEFALLPEDWDQFEPLMTGALHRVPAFGECGVRMVNGPESFTPDNRYILGEVPDMRRYFVAAGMNSSGIASAGGAGKALAEWIVGGRPTMDLWPVDVRRFGRFHGNPAFLRDRVVETLGLHYAMPWPDRELTSARPMRRSPVYHLLTASGAHWGSRFGWERANCFSTSAAAGATQSTFGRPHYHALVEAEYRACCEGVGLVDLTSSSKLLVQGADAFAFLDRVSSANVDVGVGNTLRSLLLNDAAGIEADVHISRLSTSAYLVVSATAQATRDLDWLMRNVHDGEHVVITDVTSGSAVFALIGPRSTDLLERLSPKVDWQRLKSSVGRSCEAPVGYSLVRARYTEELGQGAWMLTMPTDFAVSVFEQLTGDRDGTAGRSATRQVGHYALESLRVEKAIRVWGSDMGPLTNPVEADLTHLLIPRSTPYVGRDALLRLQQSPSTRRLASITVVGEEAVMWGGEPVYRDGVLVGYIGSAAWGHGVGGAVGLAWLSRGEGQPVFSSWVQEHAVDWQMEVTGRKYPARVQLYESPSNS